MKYNEKFKNLAILTLILIGVLVFASPMILIPLNALFFKSFLKTRKRRDLFLSLLIFVIMVTWIMYKEYGKPEFIMSEKEIQCKKASEEAASLYERLNKNNGDLTSGKIHAYRKGVFQGCLERK